MNKRFSYKLISWVKMRGLSFLFSYDGRCFIKTKLKTRNLTKDTYKKVRVESGQRIWFLWKSFVVNPSGIVHHQVLIVVLQYTKFTVTAEHSITARLGWKSYFVFISFIAIVNQVVGCSDSLQSNNNNNFTRRHTSFSGAVKQENKREWRKEDDWLN